MKAEKEGLEEDLVKHKTELTAAQQDLDKATTLRGKEKGDFEEDYANKKAATDALAGAIPAVEQGMGSASLMQLNSGSVLLAIKKALQVSRSVTDRDRSHVLAFLASQQNGKYAPASGEIVGILKNINDDMLKSMDDLSTEEQENSKGFADLKDSKTKEIEYTKEAIETKTARVGALAVEIVQAMDGADDSAKEKADADRFLATLDETCAEKKKEWEATSKARADETSAISEAINMLNADDSLDLFKKTASAFVQKGSSGTHQYGFLQSGNVPGVKRLKKAERTILATATFYKSQRLDMLLYTVRSKIRQATHHQGKTMGAVDFGEILKMIEGMVGVLENEQKDDTKHKEWCTTESAKAEDDAAKAKSDIESLDAEMANMADEISSTKDDIDALAESIKTLDKDVAQATEQRKKEHAEYLETAQLTEAAIELMGKAKNRLQKFYNPSLYVAPEATPAPAAFVQIRAVRHASSRVAPPEAPEADLSFNKNKKSGGVMELMDMLTNELKASLAEAQHDEKTAQSQYTEIMSESQETRQNDAKSVTDKSAAKATLQERLTSTKETKHMTLQELDNVGQYIQELHGSCDFILDNFKLRQEARTNEIEGLKNAKAVLNGANYA